MNSQGGELNEIKSVSELIAAFATSNSLFSHPFWFIPMIILVALR
jgi:hypothetical protein